MKPLNTTRGTVRINWNGGRNGWHSFLIGGAIIPHRDYSDGPRLGNTFHAYLGLWVIVVNVQTKYGKAAA